MLTVISGGLSQKVIFIVSYRTKQHRTIFIRVLNYLRDTHRYLRHLRQLFIKFITFVT